MALACIHVGAANGQSYPSRPIKIVVPFAAGGATDIFARMAASYCLGPSLGQQIIVENRPGGGGTLGAKAVSSENADGYSLLVTTTSALILSPYQQNDGSTDPLSSLVPVIAYAYTPFVLVGSSTVQARSLEELIALARARRLSFAFTDGATIPHLVALAFGPATGTQFEMTPYKALAFILPDLIARSDMVALVPVLLAQPNLSKGQLKAFATSSAIPLAALPDVPTLRSKQLGSISFSDWTGLMAPRGTPVGITSALGNAISSCIESNKNYIDQTARMGVERQLASSEQFTALIQTYSANFRKIITENNLRF